MLCRQGTLQLWAAQVHHPGSAEPPDLSPAAWELVNRHHLQAQGESHTTRLAAGYSTHHVAGCLGAVGGALAEGLQVSLPLLSLLVQQPLLGCHHLIIRPRLQAALDPINMAAWPRAWCNCFWPPTGRLSVLPQATSSVACPAHFLQEALTAIVLHQVGPGCLKPP